VRVCAGIVGYRRPHGSARPVRPVLEAHVAPPAAGASAASATSPPGMPDPAMLNPAYNPGRGHAGQRRPSAPASPQLAPLGLSFDAWLYFHQIPRLTALARAFPETPIVLNHCGGILGIGRYAGARDEVFAQWSAACASSRPVRTSW
jgi:L-fuconolactonase